MYCDVHAIDATGIIETTDAADATATRLLTCPLCGQCIENDGFAPRQQTAEEAASEEAAHFLRRIGFDEAKRVGLGDEDAHDCAMDLVLRAFLQVREASQPSDKAENKVDNAVALSALLLRSDLPADERTAWLRRCARNFARNFRRAAAIREGHETASGTPHVSGNYKTCAASAEADALSRLFRSDVYAAVHELPPTARAVFARFHLDEDTIVEIALSSGRSQGAIKQHLHRVRQQVRIALRQKGYEVTSAPLLVLFLLAFSMLPISVECPEQEIKKKVFVFSSSGVTSPVRQVFV